MAKAGKKSKGSGKIDDKTDDKSKKPPPPAAPQDDDYYEDGDIATPKVDRYGNDDEPL
ncbi:MULTISPECIES: hypothetical protein [unclassified Bradyrhizobium]|uniref:hypothetical protein n=1 Tax=unclassified Bradyrhizobium TaxID=2631580 RepID=UPI001BABC951|nr:MULTISPECIES: hypothetical protein [unclassified Bradyrhizobium]MBR1206330.1 hypothetical protein [Bradyrhizobium sp. AUGA SZCCT0124]MBR1314954.1 hypothetical protein [Bradyrhizobium sp. AUGA SZCCT0051]MBR1341925.1 hypothetical protein [Bradyrhizobium sp. AUGA SZCCT0105]MBR1358673.1 hypothetical protein [Bradyrhizobium sp. AUGA SZCCT0045]